MTTACGVKREVMTAIMMLDHVTVRIRDRVVLDE